MTEMTFTHDPNQEPENPQVEGGPYINPPTYDPYTMEYNGGDCEECGDTPDSPHSWESCVEHLQGENYDLGTRNHLFLELNASQRQTIRRLDALVAGYKAKYKAEAKKLEEAEVSIKFLEDQNEDFGHQLWELTGKPVCRKAPSTP